MPGRNHPLPQHHRPQHQQDTMAGAIPASQPIAEIEQERLAPAAVLVEHNGPITVHQLPARRCAAMTISVAIPPVQSRVLGAELKRSRLVLLATDKPFYYATNKAGLASAGSASTAAAIWPINVPLVLENAAEVYLASADVSANSTISIVSETWAD